MRYKLLLKKQADLKAEAQKILDTAGAEERAELSAEEQTRLDAIEAELETTEKAIEQEERIQARIRSAPSPAGARVERVHERIEDDPMRGFRSNAEFALAVRQAFAPGAQVDERLRIGAAPSDYHREGGSGEGYMVPPAMRQEIWELVFADPGDILTLVNPEPTGSNSVELLADETTPWGATGIQARWRSEGSQMTPSRLDTDARQVKLHELYAFVLATAELLQDAPRLNSRITKGAARAIRWKAAEALVNGTGAGQPLGWMKSAALITQTKEAGQAAASIDPKNIAKMLSRLLPDGLARAFWLANSDILPQLMVLTIGNHLIWTPPTSGFKEAPGGFLLGKPIKFSEHADTLGTKGDLQLVDPEGYYATTREAGPAFASSIHLYFDYAIEAFRWTFRLGGMPYLSAPVNPAKGSTTKSHFVTLETRA